MQKSLSIWSQNSYYSFLISSRFYYSLKLISTVLPSIISYRENPLHKYITKYIHLFIS